ncbi:MAG: class I SAM-dependent methyltransferase [Desulfosarcina sp.]|nr:class I SAM-dependent methyltransferase [Desulfobacterales bacterium]
MPVLTDETLGRRRVCPHKMAFMLDNWIRRLFQNPVKLLGDYIKAGHTVVDLGCGPGFFSVDMARMVGPAGRVIVVDLQPDMLDRVKKKAFRHGLAERMVYHRCRAERVDLDCAADFVLAFYMVHETPDPRHFFAETRSMLNAGGKLLVVEPKMHVSRTAFESLLEDASRAGLEVVDFPTGKGGRAVLLADR